jgi:hypothetical protein
MSETATDGLEPTGHGSIPAVTPSGNEPILCECLWGMGLVVIPTYSYRVTCLHQAVPL